MLMQARAGMLRKPRRLLLPLSNQASMQARRSVANHSRLAEATKPVATHRRPPQPLPCRPHQRIKQTARQRRGATRASRMRHPRVRTRRRKKPSPPSRHSALQMLRQSHSHRHRPRRSLSARRTASLRIPVKKPSRHRLLPSPLLPLPRRPITLQHRPPQPLERLHSPRTLRPRRVKSQARPSLSPTLHRRPSLEGSVALEALERAPHPSQLRARTTLSPLQT